MLSYSGACDNWNFCWMKSIFYRCLTRVGLIRGQKDIVTEVWETKPPQKQGCCSNVGGQTRTTRRNQNTQIQLMTTSRHSDWRDNEKGMKTSDEIEMSPTTTSLPAVSSIFDPTCRWRTDGRQHSSQLLLTVCVRRGENKPLTEYWEVKV